MESGGLDARLDEIMFDYVRLSLETSIDSVKLSSVISGFSSIGLIRVHDHHLMVSAVMGSGDSMGTLNRFDNRRSTQVIAVGMI